MREIILDTETTGLKPEDGHRLVEIGAVELFNKMPTGVTFHRYFNPERDMPKEAEAVHGLSSQFLKDKPLFAAHAEEFIQFIADSPLVIHNASFDMAFINAELARVARDPVPKAQVVDTLQIARSKHPMGPNSLDALCRRYSVDNSGRVKHGALLDSELLAEVYLEMTGGRQTTLGLQTTKTVMRTTGVGQSKVRPRSEPLPSRLAQADIDRHSDMIQSLGPDAMWLKQ